VRICDIIRRILKELDLSPEAFVHKFHVGYTLVRRWENSQTKPNHMAQHMIVEYCKERKLAKN
jgi:DNA-binding transcriptional regulator YiaG